MTHRTLLLLSLIGLLAAGFLFYALSEPPQELGPREVAGLDTRSEETRPAAPAAEVLPEPAQAPAGERVEAPASAATSQRVEPAEFAEFAVPDDALWVAGRVIFPPETPLTEKVRVTARGRRFGKDRDAPRERTTEVDRNGEFRLAFSESTKKGWLSIEADYLYLSKKIKVDPREPGGPLQIEPRLGGRVVGRVLMPTGVEPNAETLDGAIARLWAWTDGEQIQRTTDIRPDGSFVLAAVPVGSDYQITVDSARYAEASLDDQSVRRGEDTQVELEFRRGVHLAGRVVDEAGEPIPGSELSMTVTSETDGHTSSSFGSLPVDKDGEFDRLGVQPGKVELVAKAPGRKVLELDLGLLEDGDERLGLELVPPGGTFVAGSVHWPDGSAAEGARVRVQQASADGDFDWEAREFSATTDETGAFHIEGLGQRDIIVEASARRPAPDDEGDDDAGRKRRRGPLLSRRLEDASPGAAGLRLVLSEGAAISGRVLDDRGQPVERFLVEARPNRDGDDPYRGYQDRKQRGFNDAAGEFEMSGLESGRWKVRASARDGGESTWTEVELPGGAPLELVTPRGAKLSGVVRSPRGEVVPDARVEYEKVRSNAGTYFFENSDRQERTDEQGRFTFEGAAPGDLQLGAKADGWAPSASARFEVRPGEERTDIALVLRTPATLTGEVHPRAAPIAGRRVHVWGENHSDQTRTDDAGKFRLEGLPPGTLNVNLQAPEVSGTEVKLLGQAATDRVEVELLEGGTTHVVLGAPAANPIRVVGTVTVAGERAAGFAISCRGNDYRAATVVDSSGAYELEVDGPGNYNFTVAEGEATYDLRHEVEEGGPQRLDIDVPSASLSGELIGPDGAPAAEVHLTLTLERADGDKRWSKYRQAESDAEGRFEFRFLHPGEYVLRVGWGGFWGHDEGQYAIRIVDGIVLAAGETRAGQRIALDRGGRITGLVTNADGTPAVGASIHVTDAQGRDLASWGLARTDETGRFTCAGIPAGKHGVRAWMKDGVEGETTCNASSDGTVEVRIVLSGP